MRGIDPDVPVYIFTGPTDMRKGFDSLAEVVRQELSKNPTQGGLFAFFSRRRDRVKIIYWDDDGYALFYKRLEAGVFRVEEKEGYEVLTGVDLKSLLCGMDLKRIKLKRAVKLGMYSRSCA